MIFIASIGGWLAMGVVLRVVFQALSRGTKMSRKFSLDNHSSAVAYLLGLQLVVLCYSQVEAG